MQHLLNTSLAFSLDFFAHFLLHVFLSLNFCLTLWQCLLLNQSWHLCLSLQFLSLNIFSTLIQHFVCGHMTVEDLAISAWNKSRLPPLLSTKPLTSSTLPTQPVMEFRAGTLKLSACGWCHWFQGKKTVLKKPGSPTWVEYIFFCQSEKKAVQQGAHRGSSAVCCFFYWRGKELMPSFVIYFPKETELHSHPSWLTLDSCQIWQRGRLLGIATSAKSRWDPQRCSSRRAGVVHGQAAAHLWDRQLLLSQFILSYYEKVVHQLYSSSAGIGEVYY